MKLTKFGRSRHQADEAVGEPHTPQRFPRGPQQPWWLILTPLWIPVALIVAFLLLVILLVR